MGFLSKLEKLSEKYIEGFFKQKFAGQLQPADIAGKLAREMRDRKTVSVSHTYVPGEYNVFLCTADYVHISAFAASLTDELAEFVAARAAEKQYKLAGGPKVTIAADDSMAVGEIKIVSKFGAPAEPNAESSPVPDDSLPASRAAAGIYAERTPSVCETTLVAARNAAVKLSKTVAHPEQTMTRLAAVQAKAVLVIKSGLRDAYTFPLGKHEVTIGRRRTNDLCLLDTGISREHVKILYKEGSYYLTDLGSTNGTFVNGTRVNNVKLAPGDVIKIGATWLEFRVV